MPLTARSVSVGIVNTAPNIGAIITPLVIPPVALAFGWHAAFIVTGGLGFVWLAFWIFGTRNLVPIVAPTFGGRSGVSWAEVVRDRRTWAVAGAKALTDQVWWFMLFWTPDLFSKVFHLSQSQIGGPIAVIYVMAALGALTSGALFPALLQRGLDINGARKTSMLTYSCLILPIPLALQATSPWNAALLIGLALFAHQGFSTNIFGMAADIVPAARVGSVMAIGGIAGNLTGSAIIWFTGRMLDTGVGYWPMFAIAAVAYLLGTLWVHLLLPQLTLANAGVDG
jgi:ACS family hexuronate transporter-like MFS transporter